MDINLLRFESLFIEVFDLVLQVFQIFKGVGVGVGGDGLEEMCHFKEFLNFLATSISFMNPLAQIIKSL